MALVAHPVLEAAGVFPVIVLELEAAATLDVDTAPALPSR